MAANESSAIASMRVIHSAQQAFWASCGNGNYATSLQNLGLPVGGSPGYISADISGPAPVVKSGYEIEMDTDNPAVTAPAATADRSASPITPRPIRCRAAAAGTSERTAAEPSTSRPRRCSPTCPTARRRRPRQRRSSSSRRLTAGSPNPGSHASGPASAAAGPFARIIGGGANADVSSRPTTRVGVGPGGPGRVPDLALRPLPAARPARLRQLLRHQPDVQLPAGVLEPLRQCRGAFPWRCSARSGSPS